MATPRALNADQRNPLGMPIGPIPDVLGAPGPTTYMRPQTYYQPVGKVAGALLDRGEIVCDVKAWGAKGDNATDDTAAITKAVAAAQLIGANSPRAAVVFFPAGEYIISGDLNGGSNYNYLTFRGIGSQGFTGVSNIVMKTGFVTFNLDQGCVVENLQFTNFSSTASCLRIRNAGIVRDTSFSGVQGNAIYNDFTTSTSPVLIDNCYFNSCSGGAFASTQALVDAGTGSFWTVRDCQFANCTGDLINIGGITGNVPSHNTVRGCRIISGTPTNGIVIGATTSDYNIVIGNEMTGATTKVRNNSTASNNKISLNPGFNPVGYLASQPAVPASGTPLVNTSGSDWTIYMDTVGGATAVAIGATATGFTPIVGAAYVVPAGQSITFTYTVTTPTIAVFGS